MSSATPKAIVFNCHYNGLSILQELGRHGVDCVAMDYRRSIGTFSKYATFVRCPNPTANESGFVAFLREFCARERVPPVLFPTNDQWATAVARHHDALADVASICVAPWAAVQTVVEKEKFYRLGAERGYSTPRIWEGDALATIGVEDFPIAAKPRFRRMSSEGGLAPLLADMERLRLTVLETPRQLARFVEQERALLGHLVFQEYVPGLSDAMYTVGIYANARHEIAGLFTGRKVRGYPADIGDCIVGEVHGVPAHVVEETRRITREIGLTGIAEFEYKRDSETGAFRLIEINPRSWSWVGITPACGVSLPMIAYRDLSGTRGEGARPQSSRGLADGSVRYVKVLQDLPNTLVRYRKRHPAWRMSLGAWLREMRGRRVVFAEFNAGDVPVAAAALARMALGAGRKASRAIWRAVGQGGGDA